jgi:TRAP-type C4-dicarboxylate transport system substrate-binding protein
MGWKYRESMSWIFLSILLGAGMAAAGTPNTVFRDPKHVVRLGTLAQRGTSMHKMLIEMGENWRAAPDGGADLIIYPDGTMGSEVDMVRRMRMGQLQAAMLTAAGLGEIEKDMNVLQSMPLVYRSFDEVEYIRGQLKQELEAKLAAKGFVVIFWGDAGWVHFFSRIAARVPDDFKKMKIFTGADSYSQIQLMKEAGFNPVPLEWNDVLTGIKTGMIDAIPVIPLYALAGQYYTGLKYMLEVNWVPLPGAVVVTKSVWDSFSSDAQRAMLETGREAGLKITSKTRQENDEAVITMQNKHGLQVLPVTPEMDEKWQQLAITLRPAIRGKLVPEAMFDRVLHLLEQYRKSRNSIAP